MERVTVRVAQVGDETFNFFQWRCHAGNRKRSDAVSHQKSDTSRLKRTRPPRVSRDGRNSIGLTSETHFPAIAGSAAAAAGIGFFMSFIAAVCWASVSVTRRP